MAILFQGGTLSLSRISTVQDISAFTSINGTLSLAAWIYPTGTIGGGPMVVVNGQQTETTNLGPRIQMNYNAAARTVAAVTQSGVSNNNNNTTSPNLVPLNRWSFAAISVGSFGNRVYVNSVTPYTVATANPGAVPKSNYDRFAIGGGNITATGLATSFPGAMGEVAVWNVAFTTEDLNSMLDKISFKNIRPQNLVCYTPNYNANEYYEYSKNLPTLFKLGVRAFPHHPVYL